jgi:hypothetical protein
VLHHACQPAPNTAGLSRDMLCPSASALKPGTCASGLADETGLRSSSTGRAEKKIWRANLRAATCVVGTAMMRLEQAACKRRRALDVFACHAMTAILHCAFLCQLVSSLSSGMVRPKRQQTKRPQRLPPQQLALACQRAGQVRPEGRLLARTARLPHQGTYASLLQVSSMQYGSTFV